MASLSRIPAGRGLRVRIGGREVGLYRVGERIYAMDDVCPHAGFALSEGDVDGTLVICPGHAWEFDLVTGRAPGETDEPPLDRFAVRVEGDDVYVDVELALDVAT